MKRTKLDDRILPVYTKGEEIFNMVTHIVGGAMGIVALVLCIIFCHDGYGLFSGIVYGISMILLYTMSAIYHGLSPKLKAKKVFQYMKWDATTGVETVQHQNIALDLPLTSTQMKTI